MGYDCVLCALLMFGISWEKRKEQEPHPNWHSIWPPSAFKENTLSVHINPFWHFNDHHFRRVLKIKKAYLRGWSLQKRSFACFYQNYFQNILKIPWPLLTWTDFPLVRMSEVIFLSPPLPVPQGDCGIPRPSDDVLLVHVDAPDMIGVTRHGMDKLQRLLVVQVGHFVQQPHGYRVVIHNHAVHSFRTPMYHEGLHT